MLPGLNWVPIMLRKDEEIDGQSSCEFKLPLEILLHIFDIEIDLGFTCTFFSKKLSEKKQMLQKKIIATYVDSGTLLSTNFHILSLLPGLISETIKQEYSTNPHDPKHYSKRLNYIGLLATLIHEVIYVLEKENAYRYPVCVREQQNNYIFSLSPYVPSFKLLNEADVNATKKRHTQSFSILKNQRELGQEESGTATLLDIMQTIHQTIRYLLYTKQENTPPKPWLPWLSFLWSDNLDPNLPQKEILNHCISILTTAFSVLENEINSRLRPPPAIRFF